MIECDDFDLSTGFYLNFMHSLSIVAVLLNSLAIFCILYKSTKQMGAYKWYLLVYQLASTVFDFAYLGLALLVIYFPIPMGYPAAWIAQLISIPAHSSIDFVIYIGSCFGVTIVTLFIYRCHVITPINHFSKLNANGHIYKSVATFLVSVIPFLTGSFDILPDQDVARKWAVEEYTCAESAFSVPHLQIFMPCKMQYFAMAVSVMCCLAAVTVTICVLASFHFLRKSGSMSPKTKEMQKRFLLYLGVQVSIPCLTLLIPIVALMCIFGSSSNIGRGLGNFMLAVLGSHGFCAAATLILCNEPYKKFVTSPLLRHWNRRKPKTTISWALNADSNQL